MEYFIGNQESHQGNFHGNIWHLSDSFTLDGDFTVMGDWQYDGLSDSGSAVMRCDLFCFVILLRSCIAKDSCNRKIYLLNFWKNSLTFSATNANMILAQCVKQSCMRKCRNWQTSKTKDLVVAIPWGFKSLLPQWKRMPQVGTWGFSYFWTEASNLSITLSNYLWSETFTSGYCFLACVYRL